MNLDRLEFTLTTDCNSRCLHCQADLSSSRSRVMDINDAYGYLAEVVSVSKLESLMVFGGEPMLYPDRAMAVLEKAHQLQIPKIDMITNGSWGKDRRCANDLAERLETAGLNVMSISVDAFHQQLIPVEWPRNAGLASLEAGIENVTWNVTVLESLKAENEYDKRTRQILKTLRFTGIERHVHRIIPIGRALENLRQHFSWENLEGPCEGDALLENQLKNPESICVYPSGSVEICWFLSIGNARQTPLGQIIEQYDWREHPVIRILVNEGPRGLLKLSKARGFSFRENRFINKCHMCIEVRKTLSAPLKQP